jgi:hypothetical protein
MDLIFFASLCFAPIACFSERVVKILAIKTNPITVSLGHISIVAFFGMGIDILDGGKVVVLHKKRDSNYN